MLLDDLRHMPKNSVKDFIRARLRIGDSGDLKDHKRFSMSGYEYKTGACTLENTDIVNEFADLGIYDYTCYLFIDFYKGSGYIYLKYFFGDDIEEYEVSGLGTTDIIYKIFELTIFSDRAQRRRF